MTVHEFDKELRKLVKLDNTYFIHKKLLDGKADKAYVEFYIFGCYLKHIFEYEIFDANWQSVFDKVRDYLLKNGYINRMKNPFYKEY